ncbi:MAG: ATP-binding protein [Chloroflexota bacterium]
MPNPFFYGGRVNPEQFVGRRAELQRIFAGLEVAHTGQMQSFSVVGPRRIGKSSLLFYVANRYAQYLAKADKFRFAFVDLHDPCCESLDGLLRKVLDELGVMPSGGALTLVDFQNHILELKRAGVFPVICLDEFEDLAESPEQFKHKLYDAWRHLIGESALAFITASKSPLIDLAQTLGYTSPFFNVFTHLPLGELTDEQARELIARGANCDRAFTPTEQSDALLLAGKHPYKLQLAGSLLYQAKADNRAVDWAELRHEFTRQIELVGLEVPLKKTAGARINSALRWLIAFPELIGRAILESLLRLKKDDVSKTTAWIVGAVPLAILVLILLNYITVNLEDILKLIERLRGK